MSSPIAASPRAFPGFLPILSPVAACSRPAAPPRGQQAIPVTVVTLAPQTVNLMRESWRNGAAVSADCTLSTTLSSACSVHSSNGAWATRA